MSGSTISKGHWYGEAQNLSSTKEIRVFAICPTDDMAPVEFGFDEIEVPGGQSRSEEFTCDGVHAAGRWRRPAPARAPSRGPGRTM